MAERERITWGEPGPARDHSAGFHSVYVDEAGTTLLPTADSESDTPAPAVESVPQRIADRYERRDVLGIGGMGEVWRYWDLRLRRPVALKLIRRELVRRQTLIRFEEEAQISAQLQHPGIIPVHDSGVLADGRMWFTMKEVRGRTLEDLLTEVHKAWRLGQEEEGGFTFRRMLEAFLRVCETVAYAHDRGVVHRDLKPSNVMIGSYGEVLVVDWGLAKALGGDTEEPVDLPSSGDGKRTRMGSIVGTPAYMAPEQARGESATVGPQADVYALGATLYDLLAERPPRLGHSMQDLLDRVAAAEPVLPPSQLAEGPVVDAELDRICMTALAAAVADRYATAGPMAADLALWLDGARKREQAMALVGEADACMKASNDATRRARQLDQDAVAALVGVADNAPAAHKAQAWSLEDAAAAQRASANAERTRSVQLLRAALSHAPDLVDVHDRLADHYRSAHRRLETAGEILPAATALAELSEHDRSGRYASYTAGDGAITLVTDPPGATVRLHRFVEQGRRLVPVFERELSTTPLRAMAVPMGNYLLTLHKAGHDDVRYPVWIRREEHWDGVPPGASQPFPIRLPKIGELGPDDCYVPAGWYWYGDDELEAMPDLERRWAEPIVVGKFVVTTEEYLAYLNDLHDRGLKTKEEAAVPIMGTAGGPWLDRDATGRWVGLRSDLDSDSPVFAVLRATPRLPMVCVNSPQAEAFAAWVGGGARLPTEHEWQRAGRGADARVYPWGSNFEPSWARSQPSEDSVSIVGVDRYPGDVSVFGVRGMSGNVSEWVRPVTASPAVRIGGGCGGGPITNRLTMRIQVVPTVRMARLGFRLARSFL